MEVKDLYRLIRQESTLLWIGAGFSIHAGMPSVSDIKHIIYNTLTDFQKEKVSLEDNLPRFSRNCELLIGRDKLISVIKESLNKPSADSFYHDLLSRVSHFRSIVTTNYDLLIETSFKRELGIIRCNDDVFIGAKAPRRLYKIHGDISIESNLIILTEDDYNKQYNRDFKTPFWSSFLSEISSKHIIFLGYSVEDGDILSDFDKINSHGLNSGQRKFLISPTFKNEIDKIRIERMGIVHIEMTGQEFITQLIENIKENINDDYKNGKVNSAVVQEFVTAFDLNVNLMENSRGNKHMSLEKSNGNTNWKINLTTIDEDLKKRLVSLKENFDPIHIKGEKLQNFSLDVEGFNLLKKDNLEQISIIHVPRLKGKCSIYFPSELFEVDSMEYEIFSIEGKSKIIIKLFDFILKINLCFNDGNITMNFNIKDYEATNYAHQLLKIHKTMFFITSGIAFTIDNLEGKIFNHKIDPHSVAYRFKYYSDYFDKIIKIQKELNINFGKLRMKDISSKTKDDVNMIISLINNKYHATKESEGLYFDYMPASKKISEVLSGNKIKGTYLFITTDKPVTINLFGIDINLGIQQIALLEPSIKLGKKVGEKTILYPKDKILIFRYEKFGHMKPNNSVSIWHSKNAPKLSMS